MIPGLRWLTLRFAPIETLNDARRNGQFGDIGGDFTEAPELPKQRAVNHIMWGQERTKRRFLKVYWLAVHNGQISNNAPEREFQVGYDAAWIPILLDYWNSAGRLPYHDSAVGTVIRRADLRAVFKDYRIPFPLTWR